MDSPDFYFPPAWVIPEGYFLDFWFSPQSEGSHFARLFRESDRRFITCAMSSAAAPPDAAVLKELFDSKFCNNDPEAPDTPAQA